MKLSNILERAFKVIPRTEFEYRVVTGDSTNEFGQRITEYSPWVKTSGAVQPGIVASFGSKNISEKEYKDLGMDFAHGTITVWLSSDALNTIHHAPSTVHGRNSTDQVRWDNRVWNVVQVAGWNEYNGWRRCYCVEVLNLPQENPEQP